MIEDAAKYLDKYIEYILKGNKSDSFDLWEMYVGETVFGVGSVYAAMESMVNIYNEIYSKFDNNRLKQEQIREKQDKYRKNMVKLKEYIVDNFYVEERNSFVRAKDDQRIDISAMNLVYPFKVFTPNDKKILKTVETIEMNLRTYTGGYIRFENDSYIGGYNPWVTASLYMAFYHLEAENYDKVIENFNFIVNTASDNSLLAEQVDNETLKPKWVLGLTWAHGLFIKLLDEMIKRDII